MRRLSIASFIVSLILQFLFFLVVGAVLLGFGGATLKDQIGDYEKTTAVIEDISADGETICVNVTYNVDGTDYRGELGYYSDSFEIGKEITVKYLPGEPGTIRATSADAIGFILVAVGAVMVVIAVRTLIVGIKRVKTEREHPSFFCESDGNLPQTVAAFPADETATLYYFRYDKRLAQGHVMENKDRQTVYEATAKSLKFIADFEMDFINHVTGHAETHYVGHSTSVETGNVTTSTGFAFDGQNIWERLQQDGIWVDVCYNRGYTGVSFYVTQNGEPFARFEASGTNLYGEEKQGLAKIANLSAPGHYRIYSFTDNLDLLFLVGVAFARSRA